MGGGQPGKASVRKKPVLDMLCWILGWRHWQAVIISSDSWFDANYRFRNQHIYIYIVQVLRMREVFCKGASKSPPAAICRWLQRQLYKVQQGSRARQRYSPEMLEFGSRNSATTSRWEWKFSIGFSPLLTSCITSSQKGVKINNQERVPETESRML